MENILTWSLYFMTFYAFIPGLLSRVFGYRVFKRGNANNELCLTFDDGPDPVYTAQLLDLLKHYNAKATFFVVGAHAKLHPELLLRMKEEGHTIGVHNYEHKTNWLMWPKTVRKQIVMTNDIIEQVTGERSIYYRPPWGIINVFDYRNVSKMNIVLWSALFNDWHEKLTAPKLQKKLLKKVNPGEVLLLHDCGRTFGADVNAPKNMLIALEAFLEEATKNNIQMVTVDKMIQITEENNKKNVSKSKKLIVSLWLKYEKLFQKVMSLKSLDGPEGEMFHYRLITYKGKPLSLNNGAMLQKGDTVAELHLDNKKLSEFAFTSKNPLVVAVKTIREIERAMPILAKEILNEMKSKPVKALYGITMINRGADKLGFQIYDMPKGLFLYSSRLYLKLIMKVLTPSHASTVTKHAREATPEEPRIMIMSIEHLLSFIKQEQPLSANAYHEVAASSQSVVLPQK